MRYLVLADIHANLHALDAVARAVEALSFDHTLVLGDIVGYGAFPNETLARLHDFGPLTAVRGNHDKVAAGLDDAADFTDAARQVARWTSQALTVANREALAALPAGPRTISDDLAICHGTPFDEDEYVLEALDASRALRASTRPWCLYAHTHIPAAYTLHDDVLDERRLVAGAALQLEPGLSYLVNIGSVGQPRDGDPRAAFGLLDTETRSVTSLRERYDIAAAQAAIRAAGLPDALAARLARGR